MDRLEIIMKLICKDVRTRSEALHFVMQCEEDFVSKVRSAAKEILDRDNRIITLSGPTCSGKTTTAALIVDEIEKRGHRAIVVSIDDFYLDNLREETDGKKIDFDSVKTIDLEYFAEFVSDIEAGRTLRIPKFNFMTGRREGYRELLPESGDIFIFEGIQAVYPEVTALFGDRYTSVFICISDEVMCNGVYFSSHEVRLLRRIVRDVLFRNTSPQKTLAYWSSVRANEEASIFPNADNPDFLIDSFLLYELFMIAPYALPLIAEVTEDSAEYQTALSLKLRLEKLLNENYTTDLIPELSMFREFVGK